MTKTTTKKVETLQTILGKDLLKKSAGLDTAVSQGLNTVDDKDRKKLFLTAYWEEAGITRIACKKANVKRAELEEWLLEDEKFVKSFERVKADFLEFAEGQLLKNIKKGKENSLFFYLRAKAPEKWGEGKKATAEKDEGVLETLRLLDNILTTQKKQEIKSKETRDVIPGETVGADETDGQGDIQEQGRATVSAN